MAHYYDDGGNTTGTMTENDWKAVDKDSRCILSCFLEVVGAKEIGEMTGNCCVDLSCMLNDKPVCIEIKDRNFESTRYGDILVESLKQDCTNRRIMNGQFQVALAVNVYTDNVIAIANLFDKQAKHFKKYAPLTTLVKGADHNYVQKEFCSLPQRKRYRWQKTADGYRFYKM